MKLTRQADYREHDQRDFKRGKVSLILSERFQRTAAHVFKGFQSHGAKEF